MHFVVYDVFYSRCSQQHVSAEIAAILRVVLLLQEHKSAILASCVVITS
jgi:hypothetical protein